MTSNISTDWGKTPPTLLTNAAYWLQEIVDLSAFAGDGTLRLRFDFSTGGDMLVGDANTQPSGDTGLLAGLYDGRGRQPIARRRPSLHVR